MTLFEPVLRFEKSCIQALCKILKPILELGLPHQWVQVQRHELHHPKALLHALRMISPGQTIPPLGYHSSSTNVNHMQQKSMLMLQTLELKY
jgi:hypothetical protein